MINNHFKKVRAWINFISLVAFGEKVYFLVSPFMKLNSIKASFCTQKAQ